MKPFDSSRIDYRRHVKARSGSYLAWFRRFAFFFTCAYGILFLLTVCHIHQDPRFNDHPSHPYVHVATSRTGAVSATFHNGVKDCAICDFLAQAAPLPEVPGPLFSTIVQQPIAALRERPEPYLPFRFCDRSSSRAPPTV